MTHDENSFRIGKFGTIFLSFFVSLNQKKVSLSILEEKNKSLKFMRILKFPPTDEEKFQYFLFLAHERKKSLTFHMKNLRFHVSSS